MSDCGSVGLSSDVPRAVDVKRRSASFTCTLETTSTPDRDRSGVLKYAYSGMRSCSMYSPLGPVSKSYTVIDTSAADGSTTAVSIPAHEYASLWASACAPAHANGEYTVVP